MFTNAVTKRINELDAKVRQYEAQVSDLLPTVRKYSVEVKFQELNSIVEDLLKQKQLMPVEVKSGMFDYSFTKKLNQLNANVAQLEEAFRNSEKPISYNVNNKLEELENKLKAFENNNNLLSGGRKRRF